MDLDCVAYVAAVREDGSTQRRLILDLDSLADCALDESASVSSAQTAPFVTQLQQLCDREYRLTAHVSQVEQDNQD